MPAPRRSMFRGPILSASAALLFVAVPARAAESQDPPAEGACALAAREVFPRHVALEVNVLWPFVPGIFESRVLIPVLRTDQRDFRGELVTGAYADYASWVVRGDDAGKVRNLSGKLGYRQFFVYGLHAEVSANLGWRHEKDRPPSGATVYPTDIDGFQTRLAGRRLAVRDLAHPLRQRARRGGCQRLPERLLCVLGEDGRSQRRREPGRSLLIRPLLQRPGLELYPFI